MADNVYGFTDSKSMVQVVDKATQDATDSEQNNRISTLETQGTDHEGRLDTVEETVGKISAGNGIKITDGVIEHSNSIDAQGSFIGSASNALRLKFDAQGHITGVDTDPIYPPTSPGTAGQVWTSDGSGPGLWKTLGTASVGDVEKVTLNTWIHNGSFNKLVTIFTRQSQNLIVEGSYGGETADWLYGINWDNNNGYGCSSLTFVIESGYYYRVRVNSNRDDVLSTSDTYSQTTLFKST